MAGDLQKGRWKFAVLELKRGRYFQGGYAAGEAWGMLPSTGLARGYYDLSRDLADLSRYA
jgi:hypothetical protein